MTTTFKHRAGKEREVKDFVVRLFDGKGNEIYSRTMETGIIKNMPHFISGILDGAVMFDKYEDCGFGDLDMVCEINGHMLNIEFKGDMCKVLTAKGQLVQAVNMAETSKVTTIFVEGTPDNPKRLFSVSHVLCFNDWTVRKVNGIDGLNAYIKDWANYARKQGKCIAEARETVSKLQQVLESQLL